MDSWTDEKNARRCDLIDKDIDYFLTDQEREELENLQAEMLAYRKRVAPRELPPKELIDLIRLRSNEVVDE